MWGSNKKVSASEQSSKTSESKKSSDESWSKSKGKTDCSLYDSGRTDSGFLSGANLSETIVTEELTPSSPTTSKQDLDKGLSKSYSRLDSGVDVGLSDQLSELCIDESGNETDDRSNVMISRLDIQPDPEPTSQRTPITKDSVSSIPWDYYFQQDEEGDTQLHMAIIEGYTEIAFYLIKLVPNSSFLDVRNNIRQTPLHLAVLTGQEKIVRRLVCAGANSKVVDRNGNTPLHLAVAAGDFPCVRALTTPVTPSEVQDAHLRYSAPVIPSPFPDQHNYDGLTCVHLAILRGHLGILIYLVRDVQANINSREGKAGMTCLHMACKVGNESLARVLLDLCADHRVQNYAGDTPYALAEDYPSVLHLLLARGASPEVFTDSEDEDDNDEEDEPQIYIFHDIHHRNGIVNATA